MKRDLDVVGIGSMVVDRVHRAPRLLGTDEKGMLRDLESGGPVEDRVGGVVLNHLGWAAILGLRTGICGRQADDEGGRFLRRAMASTGIEAHIAIEGEASSLAEIFVDDKGARTIYMAPGATSGTTARHVRDTHAGFIQRASRVTTEVSQLPLEAALEALTIASAKGCATVLDLDVPPSEALGGLGLGDEACLDALLRSAGLLKPSKLAAAELVPEAKGEVLAVARALRARYGNRAVVVTDGEAGCAVSAEGFEGFVPGQRVKAVDTTGAGDAFLGGLLVAVAHELSWPDAARLANACGAACAERIGAFPEAPESARSRILELYEGAHFDPAPPRSLSQAPGSLPANSLPANSSPANSSPAGREQADAAAQVFEVVASELANLSARFDAASFARAAALAARCLEAGGSLHVTGVGKPEHLARYAASLFSSTGAAAFFLHATEALHGSLGQLRAGDVLLAISNGGSTAELLATVEAARGFEVSVIAVTGGLESPLAAVADCVLDAGVSEEGGPLGLAPRASAAAELTVLAALGAQVQVLRGLSRQEYSKRHPGGNLGKQARGETTSVRRSDTR